MTACYYCGRPASVPVEKSPSFTATDIKTPHSEMMCNRCKSVMFGDLKQVWVFNGERQQWVMMFLYGMSQVWRGDSLIFPVMGEPEEKIMVSASGQEKAPKTLPVAGLPAKRAEIREWLVNPPEPPFTMAIAESGKKHILYLAQESCSRDYFPVQFETDSLLIDRGEFIDLLNAFESLMALEFSKTEINSGQYRADRILKCSFTHVQHESKIAPHRYRGEPSRMLQLISFVAQKPDVVTTEIEQDHEDIPPPVQIAVKPTGKSQTKKRQNDDQLTLF